LAGAMRALFTFRSRWLTCTSSSHAPPLSRGTANNAEGVAVSEGRGPTVVGGPFCLCELEVAGGCARAVAGTARLRGVLGAAGAAGVCGLNEEEARLGPPSFKKRPGSSFLGADTATPACGPRDSDFDDVLDEPASAMAAEATVAEKVADSAGARRHPALCMTAASSGCTSGLLLCRKGGEGRFLAGAAEASASASLRCSLFHFFAQRRRASSSAVAPQASAPSPPVVFGDVQ
jgi:hypothetical protein